MEEHSRAITKKEIGDYSSHFAVGNHSAFKLHREYGETLDKRENMDWRNISEHCLVAGMFADVIAEEVGLGGEERKKVVKAAILHDWNKKYEVLEMKKAINAETLDLGTLDAIHEHKNEIMRDFGIDEEIIHLVEANIPLDTEGPKSLSEKIIWYVDAMLLDTTPVPIKDRFKNTSGSGSTRKIRNTGFSDAFKEKYGGKSLNEVQLELSEKIGLELAKKMGYEGEVEKLPLHLVEKFEERVRSYNDTLLK